MLRRDFLKTTGRLAEAAELLRVPIAFAAGAASASAAEDSLFRWARIGAFTAILAVAGCGDWPPVVDSRQDVERLPIKQVDVRARGLRDADIASLQRLHELNHLDFSGGWGVRPASITDSGLATLATLDLPRLERLGLGYCQSITNAGLVHVARLPKLQYLSLMASQRVSDEGLEPLVKMDALRMLDLRGVPGVTDRGLDVLARKKNWQTILLGGCPNVTPDGVTRLAAALPGARVVKDDKEWALHSK